MRPTFIALLWLLAEANAFSQVVQLPTLRTFSLQTSVLVPDGGTTSLGGNTRTADWLRTGPGLTSRSSASNRLTSNASVSAQIIDLQALDQAILGQVATGRVQPSLVNGKRLKSDSPEGFQSILDQQSKVLRGQAASSSVPPPTKSSIANSFERKSVPERLADVEFYLRQAKQATSKGRWASVEVFYQLAWQALPEQDRAKVLAKLIESRRLPVDVLQK
jgi:hypothetical protein